MENALKLIYRHTHADYKGVVNGNRCVLVLRNGGTWLVPLESLTFEEVEQRMPYVLKKEAAMARKAMH